MQLNNRYTEQEIKKCLHKILDTIKTIIPFSTSGGSIRGSIGLHLHKLCSKECNWKNGRLFRRIPDKAEILQWAKKF